MDKKFDYKEWNEKYHNKEIADLKKCFTGDQLKIIEKLGGKIKNKIYTGYELETLYLKLLDYYKDDDMDEEELKETKSLENTGVSRKDYNELMEKFEKIS